MEQLDSQLASKPSSCWHTHWKVPSHRQAKPAVVPGSWLTPGQLLPLYSKWEHQVGLSSNNFNRASLSKEVWNFLGHWMHRKFQNHFLSRLIKRINNFLNPMTFYNKPQNKWEAMLSTPPTTCECALSEWPGTGWPHAAQVAQPGQPRPSTQEIPGDSVRKPESSVVTSLWLAMIPRAGLNNTHFNSLTKNTLRVYT